MSIQQEEPKISPATFEWTAHTLTRWLGSNSAILLVLAIIMVWFLARPFFATKEAWQDSIVTPFTILTFVLIFLLQRSQNKAMLAIQLKLNEIIASQHGASNRLIDLENMSEAEVIGLHRHYQSLATHVKADEDPGLFHTVEEAARKKTSDEKKKGSERFGHSR